MSTPTTHKVTSPKASTIKKTAAKKSTAKKATAKPKNAAAKMNIVMIATVRLRLRNSRRSSSGCCGRKL